MTSNQNKILAYLFIGIAILFYGYIIYSFDGTGDDGDSIAHYLYARWSVEIPYLWINHWGKPVFTFLATPFAQFGFSGIQVFNSALGISTAYIAYLIADKFRMPFSSFTIPILLLMPEFMKGAFSGLTEVLFAFLLVLSLYLFIVEKYIWVYLIVSLMPFCRPDGNTMILLLGLYSICVPRLRKYIPLLIVGHIVLTLLGVFFFEENWLWVLHGNPYIAIIDEHKVYGEWTSFLIWLLPIMGLPTFILLWIGVLFLLYRFIENKYSFTQEYYIYVIALCLFMMHTIIYKFALFRGGGLTRYLIPILPLLAIVVVRGIELWSIIIKKIKIPSIISSMLVLLTIGIYNLSSAKYGSHYPKIFEPTPAQQCSIDVYRFIQEKYPNHPLYFYSFPYFSILFHINPHDYRFHRDLILDNIRQTIPKGSLVIWDDWYAVVDGKVELSYLERIPNLQPIRQFSIMDGKKKRSFAVFEAVR